MAGAQTQICPQCGASVDHLVPMAGEVNSSSDDSELGSAREAVCPDCYRSSTGSIPQGLKLRMERKQREKNKLHLWKNRVDLVKSARALMLQKAYLEAAVQYEKYLRVLELAYDLPQGNLSPEVFNKSSHSKEMTVLASVYWDLVRIYDTHPNYAQRQTAAAQKLSEFLPYSSLYSEITRQADAIVRSAKNPEIFKTLLKSAKSKRGHCFLATAAFAENTEAWELYWLRRFRDQVLRRNKLGRRCIWLYYKGSPSLARVLSRGRRRRRVVRWLITKIASVIKKNLNSNTRKGDLKPL